MKIRRFGLLLSAASALLSWPAVPLSAAPAAPVTMTQALASVVHGIVLTPAGISGDGAAALLGAVRQARLVGVGEDHVTREIPAFVSALCDATHSTLSAMVLEVGPRALEAVRPAVASPDRLARMASFNKAYSSGIAFLDTRSDNDMAAHCLAAQPRLKLVGIDQEFFGSAGLLIEMILREPLSAGARQAMMRLQQSERAHEAIAAKSGNPADLFVYTVSDQEVSSGLAALRTGGTPKARAIFSELIESRKIYRMNGNASNRERARWLKDNLRRQLPKTGKVIVKMGDWHLYRGYNPLNNRDVGNWLAEAADEEGRPSLHILILGEKGIHALYGGYKRPFDRQAFKMVEDGDYKWIQDAIDARTSSKAGEWRSFDLRPLRDRRIANLSVEWRRVLDGYDFLILIPELTPSDEIGA